MEAEKIICCDRGDNDNALVAAILANGNRRNDDPMAWAAMMNQNQQWNNPFAYLIWMMFANRFMGGWGEGFNGQNAQNVETMNQLQAIRSQLQDNQNTNLTMDAVKGNTEAISQLAQTLNIDFNALKDCCCDVRAGISRFGDQIGFSAERVIAAMERGNTGILSAVQNCCCETQKELIRMQGNINLQICQQTSELRNGQRDLGQAITQGFAQSSFETQRQTCDIIAAGNANTQRIIDTLNNHWNDENQRKIQDLKFELSQERQNNLILNRLNGCGCGYNNGCGNGCGC